MGQETEKESSDRSATEVLVECMEDFSTLEPDRIIIIYTDKESGVNLKTNCRRCEAVGMLEVGKNLALNGPGE